MARVDVYDVSVFTLGGGDVTDFLPSAQLTVKNALQNGKSISSDTDIDQIVGRSADLSIDLFSEAAGARIGNLDISAFTYGGVNYLAVLAGGSFQMTARHKETKGVAQLWNKPRYVGRTFSGMCKIMVDTATGVALETALLSSDITDSLLAFSITIGTITLTIETVIESMKMAFENEGLQEWEVSWKGVAATTSPAGTSSLLAKALNAPGTPVALSLTNHATEGMAYTGNFLVSSLGFSFDREQLIQNKFAYVSDGALAGVAN